MDLKNFQDIFWSQCSQKLWPVPLQIEADGIFQNCYWPLKLLTPAPVMTSIKYASKFKHVKPFALTLGGIVSSI